MSPPRPGSGVRPPRTPEEPPLDRFQKKVMDWTSRQFEGALESLDDWVDSPVGKNWRDGLNQVARKLTPDPDNADAASAGAGLSRYVPRLGDYVPRGLGRVFGNARMPSLPRTTSLPGLPRPSAPSPPSKDTGVFLLWLLAAGVMLLLLWKAGVWYQHRPEGDGWRLGPWPVAPGEVSTRAELVRAFEYLALLCLGRAARSRHHLDLAAQLAARPAADPPGQQDAAAHLARLYEQARYAPGDEPLPPEEIHRARRELCLLAGVAAS
jgi:hypothetical protein